MTYRVELLAENDDLARAEFSVEEVTAFAGLACADFAKVDIPETLSPLTAWRAKMAARPSIAG